jgi:Flp pilus assembly protein TadG
MKRKTIFSGANLESINQMPKFGNRALILVRQRESGVFAILTAPLLLVLIAFSALAIEIGIVYNRIVDLHGLAKVVALAAASELNGTSAGILLHKRSPGRQLRN